MYKQAVVSWNNYREMDRTRYCINWDLCALCQLENTNENLVSPVNDKRKDRGSGYKSLANNLPKFEELGQLPIQVPLSLLDEGRGIKETLTSHQASWHKSCFNKCSSAKLTRAHKRKHAEVSEDDSDDETSTQPSPIKTRNASLGTAAKSSTRDDRKRCFFCEEAGRKLKITIFKSALGNTQQ